MVGWKFPNARWAQGDPGGLDNEARYIAWWYGRDYPNRWSTIKHHPQTFRNTRSSSPAINVSKVQEIARDDFIEYKFAVLGGLCRI